MSFEQQVRDELDGAWNEIEARHVKAAKERDPRVSALSDQEMLNLLHDFVGELRGQIIAIARKLDELDHS